MLPNVLLTLAVVALIVASLMTMTGNLATKRLFDRCGVGLRGRYFVAASGLVLGLVLIFWSSLEP